jgi:oxygen-independent coproporphyrinogen-3 oxidase
MLPLLVYVHFPWCLEKCPYCDFTSYKTERKAIDHEGYADAVVAELGRRLARLERPDARLRSVFFGGGTPSLWEPRALGRVLAAIRSALPDETADTEITVECNPTSIDEDRTRALVDQGVTRVSIGVQALDDARLKFLGRLHDAAGGLSAIEAAVRGGMPRVSGDIIYGVHGQSPGEAAREAGRLVDAGAGHVSAYNLTIEQGTRFGELARRGRLPLAEEGAMVDDFFDVEAALASRGFTHYEISNHARPGLESRHNLGYWRGTSYLGLGCAAVGATPDGDHHVRWRNQPLPDRYMAAANAEGDVLGAPLVDSTEELSPEIRLRERIMLGLRLASGFDLEEAARDVGAVAWTPDRERTAARLVERGRLVREGAWLRVPAKAWIFADGVAADLF